MGGLICFLLRALLCSTGVVVYLSDLRVMPADPPSPHPPTHPPSSLQGVSLRSLTSSSCCCCPEGPGQPGPRLSHSPLAGFHSSNHANYISNCNRWGLVSGSHTLQRFLNMHQRGRRSALASTFKGRTSQEAEMARFANYSCSSTLLPCAPHAPRQTSPFKSPAPVWVRPTHKPRQHYTSVVAL